MENKWGKEPYVIVSKPDPDIPVYIFRSKHGLSRKTVHRNMPLPITSVPIVSPRSDRASNQRSDEVKQQKVSNEVTRSTDDRPSVNTEEHTFYFIQYYISIFDSYEFRNVCFYVQ